MPVKIPNNLPAAQVLREENIFVMTEDRAQGQEIRPLKICILNLMPTKEVTETQLLRVIGNTPLQVEVTLLQTASHEAKSVPQAALAAARVPWVSERKGDTADAIAPGKHSS